MNFCIICDTDFSQTDENYPFQNFLPSHVFKQPSFSGQLIQAANKKWKVNIIIVDGGGSSGVNFVVN